VLAGDEELLVGWFVEGLLQFDRAIANAKATAKKAGRHSFHRLIKLSAP